jgi:hypothetical protein
MRNALPEKDPSEYRKYPEGVEGASRDHECHAWEKGEPGTSSWEGYSVAALTLLED